MSRWKILLVSGLLACNACELGTSGPDLHIISHVFDFSQGDYGWVGDFSEYPVGDSIAYKLVFKHDQLPSNLGMGKGLMLSGTNYSDDLFMFVKKKITGLMPATEYQIGFEIEFATNAPKNSVGVGGSPGESVYLKAGASAVEPGKVAANGYYEMNIDKGNQLSGGKDMILVGNIASPSPSSEYNVVDRSNSVSFKTTTNSEGELWLIVGTDSGFEGTTTLYYTKIGVVFSLTN